MFSSDSLAHVESNGQNVKIVSLVFSLFLLVRKTYFFELILDGLSDFH